MARIRSAEFVRFVYARTRLVGYARIVLRSTSLSMCVPVRFSAVIEPRGGTDQIVRTPNCRGMEFSIFFLVTQTIIARKTRHLYRLRGYFDIIDDNFRRFPR